LNAAASPQLLRMTACFHEASLNLQRKNGNYNSCFINDRFAKKMALCLRDITVNCVAGIFFTDKLHKSTAFTSEKKDLEKG
jgi:hypothetical protein